MNRYVRCFDNAFAYMKEKGWKKIYVGIDIHSTCLEPTWSDKMSDVFYKYSEETLKMMTQDDEVCMILWSCSKPQTNKGYHEYFLNHNIKFDYINRNPEVPSTDYADFETKMYFNVILDDKAAFMPEEDWKELFSYFYERRWKKNIIKSSGIII